MHDDRNVAPPQLQRVVRAAKGTAWAWTASIVAFAFWNNPFATNTGQLDPVLDLQLGLLIWGAFALLSVALGVFSIVIFTMDLNYSAGWRRTRAIRLSALCLVLCVIGLTTIMFLMWISVS